MGQFRSDSDDFIMEGSKFHFCFGLRKIGLKYVVAYIGKTGSNRSFVFQWLAIAAVLVLNEYYLVSSVDHFDGIQPVGERCPQSVRWSPEDTANRPSGKTGGKVLSILPAKIPDIEPQRLAGVRHTFVEPGNFDAPGEVAGGGHESVPVFEFTAQRGLARFGLPYY